MHRPAPTPGGRSVPGAWRSTGGTLAFSRGEDRPARPHSSSQVTIRRRPRRHDAQSIVQVVEEVRGLDQQSARHSLPGLMGPARPGRPSSRPVGELLPSQHWCDVLDLDFEDLERGLVRCTRCERDWLRYWSHRKGQMLWWVSETRFGQWMTYPGGRYLHRQTGQLVEGPPPAPFHALDLRDPEKAEGPTLTTSTPPGLAGE